MAHGRLICIAVIAFGASAAHGQEVWQDSHFSGMVSETYGSNSAAVNQTSPTAFAEEYHDSHFSPMFMSDHEFDDFISPVSNPIWFEDPRSLTELRMLFINQMIPESSVLGGGDFQIYTVHMVDQG